MTRRLAPRQDVRSGTFLFRVADPLVPFDPDSLRGRMGGRMLAQQLTLMPGPQLTLVGLLSRQAGVGLLPPKILLPRRPA